MQNKDEHCFLYSVLAALHPADDHVSIPCQYMQYLPELKIDGLEFPLKVHDIPKFEKMNPEIVNACCTTTLIMRLRRCITASILGVSM